MDRRYKETREARKAPGQRTEAYTRARTRVAQQQARGLSRRSQATEGDIDHMPTWARTYGAPASSGAQIAFARGVERAEGNKVFKEAGGGVFGASPLIDSERREVRGRAGTLNPYQS